jgi:hypothetical protein
MDLKMPMIRVMSVIGPVIDLVTAVPSPEPSSANVVVLSARNGLEVALVDHDPFIVDGVHDLHPAGPGLEVARPLVDGADPGLGAGVRAVHARVELLIR